MQELVQLTWVVEPLSIENYAHGIEKLLLKTQVSEQVLHSEVNLLIQHIIVQDQDGKNNNKTF